MKKIALVTSTRADYGILRPLICEFSKHNDISLEIIVTGTHLCRKYGYTKDEIIRDGYTNTHDIDILLENDNPEAIGKSMGLALISFSELFHRIKPNAVIVLGDRFELLSICSSALVNKIPIIHISGGEITHGAIDDSIRHAVTKMSFLHFASCEEYRQRIIQLGENPSRVFNYGDLGIENLIKSKLLAKDKLCKILKLNLSKSIVCATFHPETAIDTSIEKQFAEIMEVVKKYPEIQFVFTKSNADTGGNKINTLLDIYKKDLNNLFVFDSLGSIKYLSLIKNSICVLGNSSSGIVEAPALRIPTINIGNRQKGRLMAESIINVSFDFKEISTAIETVQSDLFCEKMRVFKPIFDGNETSSKMTKKILETLDNNHIFYKEFYDIDL